MCIFTPRLCNKNKKITYEQINRKHKTYLRLHRYTYGLNKKQYNYTSPIFFPLMDQNTMCVFGCVLCFVPLLSVHLRMRIFSNASSIAGVSSTWSGVCGLPYYCAPPVCVPTVIGVLAVRRRYKPKTKNHVEASCVRAWLTRERSDRSQTRPKKSTQVRFWRKLKMRCCCDWSASCVVAVQTNT